MFCTYIRPDGEPCQTSNVVDPTRSNENYCAFHVPLDEKENWPTNARDVFMNYLLHGVQRTHGELCGAVIPAWVDFQRIPWHHDKADLSAAIIDTDVMFHNRGGVMKFDGAKISGSLTLSNCKLDGLYMNGLVVQKKTTVQETKTGKLSATRAKFLGGLLFASNCDSRDPDFSSSEFGSAGQDDSAIQAAPKTLFSGQISRFSDCVMWGVAHMSMRLETLVVDFARSTFEEDANFVGTKLGTGAGKGAISFDSARFLKNASFQQAQFRAPTTFRDIELGGDLKLESAQFHQPSTITTSSGFKSISATAAVFHNFSLSGRVSGNADFRSARFNSPVKIEGQFDGHAFFRDAHFVGHLDISGVRFNKTADFSTSGDASFSSLSAESATFNGDVSFEHRIFGQETSFSGTTFQVAPRFFGANLHASTTFGEIGNFRDVSKQAIKRYQALRHKCEELRSRHEEGIFHALEQRARCKSGEMPKIDRAFSVLYDFAAVYGTSLSRPIWGLFLVWTICTLLFALAAVSWNIDPQTHIDWMGMGDAALNSATNIFAPFYQFRQSSGWPAAAHLMQSLVAVPLIAVFLLALRWRFRRG